MSWEKLSPAEFQELQDYAAYSNKRIADVLLEFEPGGCLSEYNKVVIMMLKMMMIMICLLYTSDAADE